jgi:hypothetical protein
MTDTHAIEEKLDAVLAGKWSYLRRKAGFRGFRAELQLLLGVVAHQRTSTTFALERKKLGSYSCLIDQRAYVSYRA